MGILGEAPKVGGGGPSRRDRRQQRGRSRPRPPARQDSERRAQRVLLIAIALIAVIVVGVGAFGYYQTSINVEKESVLRVGDRSFDMGYMERRLRYTIREALVGDTVLSDPQTAAYTAITNVRDEELDRQGAAELGISISEEEIDADIRLQLRVPESADTGVFAEAYRNEVRQSGLHPSEYREVVAARLREEKLRQRFREQIPATAEQVHLRDILVSEDNKQAVLDRLAAGEDFAALATEVSLDSNKALGGDMDWLPRGALPLEVESVVFALEVGQVSEPIALSGGGYYYLYQVLEKAADMEVTTDQRQQIEEQMYTDWRAGVAQQFLVVYSDNDTALMQQQLTHLMEVAQSEGVGAGGG